MLSNLVLSLAIERVQELGHNATGKPDGCRDHLLGTYCAAHSSIVIPIVNKTYPSWYLTIAIAISLWFLIYALITGYTAKWSEMLSRVVRARPPVPALAAIRAESTPLFIAEDPRVTDNPSIVPEEEVQVDFPESEQNIRYPLVKATCWIWLATIVSIIWFNSLGHSDATWKIWVRLIVGAAIPPLILLLEGIELALFAVEDKAFDNRLVRHILDEYESVGEPYMRAREWCLAALIVLLTVVVEFEKYYVPFAGYAEGWVIRSSITFVLASMVVIWVAQSPGKELGKKTPLEFLCGGRLPEFTRLIHLILIRLATFSEVCQIDRPTRLAYRVLRGILNLPKPKGELPPGGNRFFAELMRRYRYGECAVAETFTINDDGSANLELLELVYIGKGFPSYTRLLFAAEPFVRLPDVTLSAHRVNKLDVKMERSIELWNRGEGLLEQIELLDDKRVVKWHTEDKKAIEITVQIPDAMKLDEEHGILLKVHTNAYYGAGSFCGPESAGEDWYVRQLAKPCFRAVSDFVFADGSGPARMQNVQLKVEQTHGERELLHLPETENFQNLLATRDKQLSRHDGVAPNKRELRVELQFGLPGATYRVDWEVKRIEPTTGASA